MYAVDTILLRCAARASPAQCEALKDLAAEAGAAGARAYENDEEIYIYFDLSPAQPVQPEAIAALEAKARERLAGAQATAMALQRVFDAEGASAGQSAPVHYVV